jgi:hypothetical protein
MTRQSLTATLTAVESADILRLVQIWQAILARVAQRQEVKR